VQIGIDDHAVVARVSNVLTPTDATGAGAAADAGAGTGAGAPGYGLIGLREQTASLGGELRSGPEGDEWVVECRLPMGGAA
jgi:glucose-6-phosphate-specific signal transduction histidine kinase